MAQHSQPKLWEVNAVKEQRVPSGDWDPESDPSGNVQLMVVYQQAVRGCLHIIRHVKFCWFFFVRSLRAWNWK